MDGWDESVVQSIYDSSSFFNKPKPIRRKSIQALPKNIIYCQKMQGSLFLIFSASQFELGCPTKGTEHINVLNRELDKKWNYFDWILQVTRLLLILLRDSQSSQKQNKQKNIFMIAQAAICDLKKRDKLNQILYQQNALFIILSFNYQYSFLLKSITIRFLYLINNPMIQNIVILLLANTFLPLFPVPPEIFIPLPVLQPLVSQPTVYEHLNLTRLHTEQEFKKSFRDALKALHPDRGGSQQTFTKVKNLKQIMQRSFRYYDTLNITDADLAFGQKIQDVVLSKEMAYYVSTSIFYFITLLYGIAFTIDDDLRPSRKYIIIVVLLCAAYQYFMHNYSQTPTIFDYVYPKQPIFIQKDMIKNILSVIIAVIRIKFIRRQTEQKKLVSQLIKQDLPLMRYKQILQNLCNIYKGKNQKKKDEQNSWFTKIRLWISTIISVGILLLVIRGFFVSDQNGKQL